ncbi:lipid A-modifier LpxR family protein [Phenylobacterium sp.]|uniref:lipid A-modifier LpxR family protein n=1 Tax=Phenylobacterium sp. TaxID=1871053 RepID=UPI0025DFECE9|nr:lipid A-modifier LpxR family protein [Phenylobacterium sp.]
MLATVVTCAAASTAGAQTHSDQTQSFSNTAPLSIQLPAAGSDDQVATEALLNGAAFAPRTASSSVDPISDLINHENYDPGVGLVRWMTGATQLPTSSAGAVDSLRISIGGTLRTPGGLPLNISHGQYDASAYEVALTRDWPAALAYDGGGFGIEVTPHAGVGMTNLGGSAEAGATLRLMQKDAAIKERLNAMGVRDGDGFGDKGRWYLFAAASGRAVGYNMLHGEQGWDRAGVTTDQTSTLIGDTQVGVGWRKGDVQTSFGYIHRDVKGAQSILWGVDPRPDSMVAFSFQIRPH